MVAFAIDKEIFVFGDVVIPATPTRIETACMFSRMFSRVFSCESRVFSRENLRELRTREFMRVRTRVDTAGITPCKC